MATLDERMIEEQKHRDGLQKQKKPSGHGKGKWQTQATIEGYRKKRNAKNKIAKRSRRK